jgi:hypothetical protein
MTSKHLKRARFCSRSHGPTADDARLCHDHGGDGHVGALLVIVLTVQAGEPLIVASVLGSLAVLLAALGLYSAWALLGGKM